MDTRIMIIINCIVQCLHWIVMCLIYFNVILFRGHFDQTVDTTIINNNNYYYVTNNDAKQKKQNTTTILRITFGASRRLKERWSMSHHRYDYQ